MATEGTEQRSGGMATELLEYIYGVLFQPVPTMGRLAEERPLGLAVLVQVALATLSAGLTLLGSALWEPFVSPSLLVATTLLAVVSSLIIWVTVTGVLQILAEMLGGRSTGLLAVTGFAEMPLVFTPVVAVLGRAGGRGVEVVLSLALVLWVTVLYALAVRETHGLTTARAAGTLVLGGAALLVLLFAVIFVVIAFWQSLLQGLH